MKSIAWILFALVLFLGCTTENQKPNFVFFLVDDLGYSDVGCFGSDYYETPNIDRVARDGMKFTSAYAGSSICSPTRASILTGKYAGRTHVTAPIPIISHKRQANDGNITPLKDPDYCMNLPLEEVTIAEALKPAGYASASIGKWHVCDEPEYFPEYQGFDLNVAGDGHGATKNYFYPYYNRWRMTEGYPYLEWNTLPDGNPGEYLTDRLTVEAVNFMEENKDRPFFLYLSHYAVHTPIQSKDSLIQKYTEKPRDSLKGHIHPEYAAMIESVDHSMGAVQKKLEDLGLVDNTIIIFYSDNGGHRKWTTNYPLRGHKADFYEGGIRVPLIVKWPGVTASGSVSDVPVISNDLYPTMLEMADLPLKPEQHLDGLSLLPLLKEEGELDRDALYWHFPHYSSMCNVIRYHDWKLIESLKGDGQLELYDLKNDIGEEHDLAVENPAMVEKLQQMLHRAREDMNVQMPEPNPAYNK